MSSDGATEWPDWTGDASAVLEQSARLRAKAVRTRIEMLATFVETTKVQLRLEQMEEARESFGKIQRAVSEIEFHLQEPRHLPPESAAELRRLLTTIRPKIKSLEKALTKAG